MFALWNFQSVVCLDVIVSLGPSWSTETLPSWNWGCTSGWQRAHIQWLWDSWRNCYWCTSRTVIIIFCNIECRITVQIFFTQTSNYCLCRLPEHFEDPLVFDPNRFDPARKRYGWHSWYWFPCVQYSFAFLLGFIYTNMLHYTHIYVYFQVQCISVGLCLVCAINCSIQAVQ